MGLFGPTVRDFSKSEEGRKCLEALFDYEALPKPNLTRVPSSPDLAKDILGRAFEYLLQLLIERQNPNFRLNFLSRKDSGMHEPRKRERLSTTLSPVNRQIISLAI